MFPADDEVLHFSEDPRITEFVPHVAKTAQQPEAYVWAVDRIHAPAYWFPRDCPRAMARIGPTTTPEDVERILGPGGGWRVHAIEHGWLERFQSVVLYAYRFAKSEFRPFGDGPTPHAWVSTTTVRPLGPAEPVGSLVAAHDAAGIQLRVLDNLWAFWDACVASSLPSNGIRLLNARPRRENSA